MGDIYNRFKELQWQAQEEWFLDELGLVTFENCEKKYEIYFTRRKANKYSIIHCENNTLEWEQFPVLPRIIGRMYGKRQPIITLSPSKDTVKIVVITGNPNSICGLDNGIFRSVHTFDEKYVNVMSETCFKEL